MAESILTSVKAQLGLAEAHTAFDTEITLFVNSVLSRLTQLGLGPDTGFSISSKQETWEDFLGADHKLLNNAKSYMGQRVKLMFDPPEVGFVLTAMKEQIEKEEWLLNVTVDNEVPVEEVISVESEPYFG